MSKPYPELDDKRLKELEKVVGGFLDNYSGDDMHTLFGDCIKLTVNRKGITTDEYCPY